MNRFVNKRLIFDIIKDNIYSSIKLSFRKFLRRSVFVKHFLSKRTTTVLSAALAVALISPSWATFSFAENGGEMKVNPQGTFIAPTASALNSAGRFMVFANNFSNVSHSEGVFAANNFSNQGNAFGLSSNTATEPLANPPALVNSLICLEGVGTTSGSD